MLLFDYLRALPKAAIAFSGGVDSSYLLYAAKAAGMDFWAYYIKTAFQPEFELRDAIELAAELNAPLTIIEHDVLSSQEVAANPENRCYYCKTKLFSLILDRARTDGCQVALDGTNASDDAGDRPGMRALAELSVLSPLRECGLTKDEIRRLSKEAGLFTWDKPAYACLATRFPTGTDLTVEGLEKLEKSEDALRQMGFSDFRVRVRGARALLQLKREQFSLYEQKAGAVFAALEPFFESVSLDAAPR